MNKKTILILLPVIITGLVLMVLQNGNVFAQPGSETDPVISLSYLETALSCQPVSLEGGEELRIEPGLGIILIEGSCGLISPEGGRSRITDVSEGTVFTEDIELIPGHMYIPIMLDDGEVEFIIQAWQTSTIAIPGGSGR